MNGKKDNKKSAADLLSESLMRDLIDSNSKDSNSEDFGSQDQKQKKPKGDHTKVAGALLSGDGIASNDYTSGSNKDLDKTGPAGVYNTPENAGRMDVEEVDRIDDNFGLANINKPEARDASGRPGRGKLPPDSSVPAEDGRTIVNQQFAPKKSEPVVEPKVSVGAVRPPNAFDFKFGQAETLKLAQKRINELEREFEKIRRDNEVLSAAGELSRNQADELMKKIQSLERLNFELRETNENELVMFKEALQQKDSEKAKLRVKIEELENRLAQDMRRIRVRERELENRLELARVEKNALTRAKDEAILELNRKVDVLETEVDTYKNRIVELQARIESNQEQFGRTVRALRLALTNLEASDDETNVNVPLGQFKKAE